METEIKNDEIEIDIKELFSVIMSKIIIIILGAVLGAVVAYAYTKVLITPQYTSTTKVYIRNETDADTLTTSDLAMATYVARDLQEIVNSEPVLKKVRDSLNLSVTTKTLGSWIKVSLIEDTRILKIEVTTNNPETSQLIADSIRNIAMEQTPNIMGVEAIKKIDDASLPVTPSSPQVTKNVVIGFGGGAALVILIVVILFLMDDTIKTQEDIEKYLGISVLASIPVQKTSSSSGTNKKKKKS